MHCFLLLLLLLWIYGLLLLPLLLPGLLLCLLHFC